MSFPTTPAFIHHSGWSAQTRAHPAMAWMETYTKNAIDSRAWTTGTPASEWHTSDFSLQKSDGSIIQPGEKAWNEGLAQIYGPFTAHLHSPNFLVCKETDDGWQMFGQGDVFVNLPGDEKGEKVKDGSGKEWDILIPSAFWFQYVKDKGAKHGGILLKSTKIYGDSAVVMGKMIQRGMVKKEDMGF